MASRSCAFEVTLSEFARRKPSGILSAAVVNDRGASVSSGFPSWRTLGGSRPLAAISLWPCPHQAADASKALAIAFANPDKLNAS